MQTQTYCHNEYWVHCYTAACPTKHKQQQQQQQQLLLLLLLFIVIIIITNQKNNHQWHWVQRLLGHLVSQKYLKNELCSSRTELYGMFACIRRGLIIAVKEKFSFQQLLLSAAVAADVTETSRLLHTRAAATGKARSPKDESVEQQRRWWWLIAVVAKCQELKQFVGDWRGMVVPGHGDSAKQVEHTFKMM